MDIEKAEGRKSQKSKRPLADRYAWHRCEHHKKFATTADLTLEQHGLYDKLILLGYCRRGPLPNDDVWLARTCNADIRVFRRIKAELISKGKISVDEENGLLFDERTIPELVDAEVYSERQRDRAGAQGRARRTKTPPPRLKVISNIAPIAEAAAADLARTVRLTVPGTVGDSCGLSSGPFPEKSKACENKTSANEKKKKNLLSSPPDSQPMRAAQPPNGGGAPNEARARRARAIQALKDLKPAPTEAPAADQTARRIK